MSWPAAMLLGALALGGETLHAQQLCGNESRALSYPTDRFEDHADGTVTDKESRLMWMRCSAGQTWSPIGCAGGASGLDWESARAFALDVNRRGSHFFNDWRVPLLKEIATISERQCEIPRVNLSVFPDTPAAAYWTASSRSGNDSDSFAFVLGFDARGVTHRPKEESMFVRLVRNSQ